MMFMKLFLYIEYRIFFLEWGFFELVVVYLLLEVIFFKLLFVFMYVLRIVE